MIILGTGLAVAILLLLLLSSSAAQASGLQIWHQIAGHATIALALAVFSFIVVGWHQQYRQEATELFERSATPVVFEVIGVKESSTGSSNKSSGPRTMITAAVREVDDRKFLGPHRPTVLLFCSFCSVSSGNVEAGQILQASLRLKRAAPGDRVVAIGAMPKESQVVSENSWRKVHNAFREGLWKVTRDQHPMVNGLLSGLVLGETGHIDSSLTSAMQRSGLTHLVAASGSNCLIVIGAVMVVLRPIDMSRTLRISAGVAALVAYMVAVGPEPSILRAGAMALVSLIGLLAGRPGGGLTTLWGCVVLLLAIDPWLSREYGFGLSVLATLGLLLFASDWAKLFMAYRIPKTLAHAGAIPLSAQVLCTPLLILLQPELTPYSLLANMLVAPAVPLATIGGSVVTVGAFLPAWITHPVGFIAGIPAVWIGWVARQVSALPGSALTWLPGFGGLITAALLSVVFILVMAAWACYIRIRQQTVPQKILRQGTIQVAGASNTPETLATSTRLSASELSARNFSTYRAVALSLVFGVVVGGLCWYVGFFFAAPSSQMPTPKMVSCDVGQGDASLILAVPQRAVLIDTGPEGHGIVSCLDGQDVQRVELLVITHFHNDHTGGVEEVLRRYPVQTLLIPHERLGDPEFLRIRDLAVSHNTSIVVANTGYSMQAAGAEWTVLAPEPCGAACLDTERSSTEAGESSRENNRSLVMFCSISGRTMLFLGDIEPEAQQALNARLRDVAKRTGHSLRADIVKVAHHGSAHQYEPLYEGLSPQVMVVSAGAGNSFGHPAPEVLDIANGLSATLLRTDTMGQVRISLAASGMRYETDRIP